MNHIDSVSSLEPARPTWRNAMMKYQDPSAARAIWQLSNSFIPYVLVLYLMYRSIEYSYLLTLALVLPAVGFITRIFIIQHDCGHGSFFRSRVVNNIVGSLCGILTFTPYFQWRHDHALHHAGSGQLDKRGTGDIHTMTVAEYQKATPWRRFWYRVYRHPVILFGVEGFFLFLVLFRFSRTKGFNRRRWSVYATNLAILAMVMILGFTIGFKEYVLVQLPILDCMSVVGMWLFHVQHQFEDTYWEQGASWDYVSAAERGSSYYKLPKVLQWFTGNIGLHHLHHLNPRIANYRLQRCQDDPELDVRFHTLTLWSSLKTLHLRLWDEERKRMVGFSALKKAVQQ